MKNLTTDNAFEKSWKNTCKHCLDEKKLKMFLALANHPFEFRETTFEW